MSLSPTQIAAIAHEANRKLQSIQADPSVPVAAAWEDISSEMRESVISGVFGIQRGLTPEESHEGWCKFKRQSGWVYGPVKDEVKREHPCLVPYDKLPAGQQIKDHLFSAIVKALS